VDVITYKINGQAAGGVQDNVCYLYFLTTYSVVPPPVGTAGRLNNAEELAKEANATIAQCEKATNRLGFAGLTYAAALEIWHDGNLGNVKNGATIAALAAVTWQGESSFGLKPTNQPNVNAQGVVWSVDYGPFMINPYFYPNATGSVIGTNGARQQFNGNADANITFGIGILETLYNQWGNNAAGHYVGSLGYDQNGNPTPGQKRENTWNAFKNALTSLFSDKDCFPSK
jgi:hypothetical protein